MKRIAAFVACMMVCGVSHAKQVLCSGEYFGYQFVLKADVVGTKISGNINLDISNGSSRHSMKVLPTASDIRVRQYIRASGRTRDGSQGSVSADFNAGAGTYNGTLQAQTSQGSVNVPVTCSIRGARFAGPEEMDLGFMD